MRIGFASLVGVEPTPLAELVGWAAANGLPAIEVNVGPGYPAIEGAEFPGHLDLRAIVTNGRGMVDDMLGDSGVTISSLAPMLNLLTADESLRAERSAYVRLAIEACAVLGLETLVTFAGSAFGIHFQGLPGVGDDHPSNRTVDNLRIFGEVYGPLADFAADKGVRIAFETAGRGGGEGNIAHSPEIWEGMFNAVPSPALGLSFDPSHPVWLGIPDAPALIRRFADRIYHVDGKDCEILPDRLATQGILGPSWWRYRLPGMGEVDWPGIFAALHEIGYDDVISIENEDPLHPGRAGVAMAARYLERYV